MYTPKHIAEAMAELFDDPKWEGGMGATTIAWCNLWDRVASETGLSEEALMQLMKEGFLLRMEQKRQMGKVMRLLPRNPEIEAAYAVSMAAGDGHHAAGDDRGSRR